MANRDLNIDPIPDANDLVISEREFELNCILGATQRQLTAALAQAARTQGQLDLATAKMVAALKENERLKALVQQSTIERRKAAITDKVVSEVLNDAGVQKQQLAASAAAALTQLNGGDNANS